MKSFFCHNSYIFQNEYSQMFPVLYYIVVSVWNLDNHWNWVKFQEIIQFGTYSFSVG